LAQSGSRWIYLTALNLPKFLPTPKTDLTPRSSARELIVLGRTKWFVHICEPRPAIYHSSAVGTSKPDSTFGALRDGELSQSAAHLALIEVDDDRQAGDRLFIAV
jgi:hypothetical protein